MITPEPDFDWKDKALIAVYVLAFIGFVTSCVIQMGAG